MCTLQSVKKVNMCEKGKFIHELRDTHFHLINDVIEAARNSVQQQSILIDIIFKRV